MLDDRPKISVLVITYNQENVISRAIDSLLTQKDYIYEICVSDDCSKDRTWEILQDYSTKYPGLFVLNRNEPNLGIFENIEKTWSMPSGDIIYQLAGDDECGANWFEKVVNYIKSNNIDFKSSLFGIYGDYECIYPNGDVMVFQNDFITYSYNPVSLSLLGVVGNRGCCFSHNVLKKFQNVSIGKSHIAETAQDIQMPLFIENFYYIGAIGNVYYTNIGISSDVDEKTLDERKKIMPYAFEILKRNGYKLTKEDYNIYRYNIAFKNYYYHKSVRGFFSMLHSFALCYICHPRYLYKYFKLVIFSIIRRISHNQHIVFYC